LSPSSRPPREFAIATHDAEKLVVRQLLIGRSLLADRLRR
jgi:hypothetical protein